MEVRQVAINFIKMLNKTEKDNLKIMLNHGVICGTDYAKQNEIQPAKFTEELKSIFGGK